MPSAANVTKFVAGGSGDNVIADGFIKTVEKIWMDSYTIAFTGTNSTIDIAVIPNKKKITGIDVIVDTSISQSNGTISIGFASDASVATFLAPTTISHNLTRSVISLPFMGLIQSYASATITNATQVLTSFGVLAGYQYETAGTQTTISIKLNNWTMTTGSLKTVVKWT